MAEHQGGSAHAGEGNTAKHAHVVSPSGAVTYPPVTAPCSEKEPCYTKDAASEQLPPNWRRPEWVIVYVTVIYAFITWLTLRAIKRQANLMDKQAEDARNAAVQAAAIAQAAANAALLNAQAVINAERALLLFKVVKVPAPGRPGYPNFLIYAHNYGRLPARTIEIGHPSSTLTLAEELEQYLPVSEEPIDVQEWLAPGQQWLIATFCPYNILQSAIIEAANNMHTQPFLIENVIFGEIKYRDGISTEQRHSRYCLAHYKGDFADIGGSVRPVGSDEYNECS